MDVPALDEMILLTILEHMPPLEILRKCTLVNKEWYKSATSPLLWEHLVSKHESIKFLDTAQLEEKQKEAEEFVNDNSTFAHLKDRNNIWLKIFVILTYWETLEWDASYLSSKDSGWGNLLLSEDGKKLTKDGTSTHLNMVTTKSFSKGVHRWRVKVDGLKNGFWLAVGVCRRCEGYFNYYNGQFPGYTSFGARLTLKTCEDHHWPIMEDGDIIEITLNFNTGKMTFVKNKNELGFVEVPTDEVLYPWTNIYEPGSNITLLD